MIGGRSASTSRSALRGAGVLAVLALGVVCAVALLRPASSSPAAVTSSTSRSLESMFQDDGALLHGSQATVARTLDALRALGVDRLRITVLWAAIAPDAHSRIPPKRFDAADPAAYPAAGWAPYDRVIRLARARGLAVDFDVSAPGPLWAMRPGAPSARLANHYAPSAAAFAGFVEAAGRRYSGTYVPRGAGTPLPRVSFWSVWNEPNQPGWLAPQRGRDGTIQSARLYRGYVDAAVSALRRSGHRGDTLAHGNNTLRHGRDTILIGELAPEGVENTRPESPAPPIPFLDALYCVDANHQPLAGAAAARIGCPASGSRSAFVAAHPGLFEATAFAHHPYSFFLAPGASMTDPNFVPLSDLGRLERALDAIFSAYSVHRRIPLYLTEYGYETNPPNPLRGVSPATQAAYLDQATYMAWRDPRVRGLSQFELFDSPPDRAYPRGSVRYWSTFQTGLVYVKGAPKPSFYTYRLPIFIPGPPVAGGEVTVWGMVRAAPGHSRRRARVQWQAAGERSWRTLAVVNTDNPTGAFTVRVTPPSQGQVRLAWTPPGQAPLYSRTVGVG